jgi:hypothetical protein
MIKDALFRPANGAKQRVEKYTRTDKVQASVPTKLQLQVSRAADVEDGKPRRRPPTTGVLQRRRIRFQAQSS